MVKFFRPETDKNLPKTAKLSITGLDHKLRGIAKLGHKTVFADGALPGEQVEVRLGKQKAKVIEASVIDVLEAHPDRLSPPCKHFGHCGGCQLQMMPSSMQLEYKQNNVQEQLERWANTKPLSVEPPLTGANYGYRRRSRLHVNANNQLGFIANEGKAIVTIGQCPILEPALESLLKPLRQWLSGIKKKLVTHIELLADDLGAALVVRHIRPLSNSDRQALSELLGIERLWFQPDKANVLFDVNNQELEPQMSYELDGANLTYHPKNFTQANREMNQKMVAQAMTWLAPQSHERVLELFSGMGNFTLALAKRSQRVIAIEGSEDMVARGRYNAHINDCESIQWLAADLSDPKALSDVVDIDCALLDPPRDGAEAAIEALIGILPQRILYVSCHSATFVRDAARLVKAGYELSQLNVMDMFPQTYHSEVMGLFERSNRKG